MNAQRIGRCLNVGRCGLADQRGPIPIEDHAHFTCPECKCELIAFEDHDPHTDANKKRPPIPKMLLVPALLLGLLAIIGISFDPLGIFGGAEAPALAGNGMTPGTVRTGTSIATYDELAPMLWRAFLIDQGCPQVERPATPGKTSINCATGASPKVVISAPDPATNRAGTTANSFDVLLTTDPSYVDAPSNDRPVIVPAEGTVIHGDVIGVEALAVIVNPANPLARLSQQQLAGIFLGSIRDFAAVGGRPGPIKVIAPAAGGRANDGVTAIVPQWLPITATASRLADTKAIVAAVLADPQAIGLVERRAATAAHIVAIGPVAGVAVAPTPVALISGDYPLARPIRAIRFNRDDSPYETGFVSFTRSEGAQAAIAAAGFEPVRPDFFKATAPAGASAAYRKLVNGSSRVAANLRFGANSLDLDTRGRADLDVVAARLAVERIPADRIHIIGLSDPGRPDALTDADSLARQVAKMLAERGIDTASATGLGGSMPIAEPPQGHRNRRVEIWLSPGGRTTLASFR